MTKDIESVPPEQPLQGERQQPDKTSAECVTDNNLKWKQKKYFVCVFVGLVLVVLAILLPLLQILGGVFNKDDNRPLNDDCETATELIVGGEPIMGTFVGATPDPGGAYCGASGDDRTNKVVWYKFNGTGNAVHVDTWPTWISVASYAGDCDDLRHPSGKFGDDASLERCLCDNACRTFWTQEDQTYFLYTATCPCDHCEEDFNISVREVNPPTNTDCENAMELSTTNGTTYEMSMELIACSCPQQSYLWYFVESGLDKTISLNGLDLNSIDLYKGTSCDDIKEVDSIFWNRRTGFVELSPSLERYYMRFEDTWIGFPNVTIVNI